MAEVIENCFTASDMHRATQKTIFSQLSEATRTAIFEQVAAGRFQCQVPLAEIGEVESSWEVFRLRELGFRALVDSYEGRLKIDWQQQSTAQEVRTPSGHFRFL